MHMVIHVVGLTVRGHHGVLPEERRDGQDFVVDLAMEVLDTSATHTDHLTDTVDYAAVVDAVAGIVAGEPVDLIEHLARQIADCVLEDPRVSAVTVTVAKPQAPVAHPVRHVAVELRVERPTP